LKAEGGEVLLYHGTIGRRADECRVTGIRPRLAGEGVWPEKPSRIDCVYLTTVYGGTYAKTTFDRHGDPAIDEMAVIEVDSTLLDENLLLPDEDFLDQCISMKDHRNDMGTRRLARTKALHDKRVPRLRATLEEYMGTDWLDQLRKLKCGCWKGAERWQGDRGWEASIKGLGTCAYRGTVAPEAIIRIAYCKIDPSNPHHVFRYFQIIPVTIDDHRKHGIQLGLCNRWLFGDSNASEWSHVTRPQDYKTRTGFRVWSAAAGGILLDAPPHKTE
jgi:hypothetical protein